NAFLFQDPHGRIDRSHLRHGHSPSVGIAVSDDRASEARSQPNGFYFPRYGMLRKIRRLLR
ncbi:MAG TPA: hypothetical protein VGO54_08970, partial [Bradyrhizobium sp.]|nr:hypothetical protein [Bradyrhizobium sp.]